MAISRERARVEREGKTESFESGGVRHRGVTGAVGLRMEVGSRKDESALGMDFVRWNEGERWDVRKDEVAKSF